MIMTDEEIKREFRMALKPDEQITILANLNQCSEHDIARIVKDVELDEEHYIYGANRVENQKEALHGKVDMLLKHYSSNDRPMWKIKLIKAIEDKHVNVKQLAKAAGVASGTMYSYVSEERNIAPQIPTAIRICEHLGVTLNDIFWEGEEQ